MSGVLGVSVYMCCVTRYVCRVYIYIHVSAYSHLLIVAVSHRTISEQYYALCNRWAIGRPL